MFRTVPLPIIRSFSLYTQQWYMSYRFADSLLPSCQQTYQRICPKHVECYSKNKFEKLVHLVGFIIRIYHDAWSLERQILLYHISYRIVSYHIISYRIISYRISYISYRIIYHISYHISYIVSYIISYRISCIISYIVSYVISYIIYIYETWTNLINVKC